MTQRDDGHIFLGAVLVVGWLAWISFAVPAILEIVARVSGRPAWRIPFLRGQQRWAAMLVTSVALMSPAPAMASTAAAPMHTAPPRIAAVAESSPQLEAVTAVTSATSDTADRIHTVQRGEMLLDLAERYSVPYEAIAAANHGIVQPDGRTLQPGQGRLYPGWKMRIPPATATTRTTTITPVADLTTTAPAAPMIYHVKHGDWLWFIAERYLGDPERYPEIAQLNPGLITAATGTHGPSHIEGGWKLILPADAHDRGPRDHARGSVHAPQKTLAQTPQSTNPPGADGGNSEGQPSGPSPTTAPTTTPPSQAAASPAPSSPSAAPSTSPSTAAASTAPTPTHATAPANHDQTATDAAPSASDSNEAATYISLAGAGLLSALVLGAVLRKRRRQQQHRRPQRRLPHPRGGATETALRVAEQPADVDRLDTALRALAVDLAQHDQAQLPDIIGAWIAGGSIHVVLAAPCAHAPAAWIDEGNQWTLPASAHLPDVDGNIAPLPALVAIGHQPGRHLLLDLERLGSISIGGDETRARNLLRYLASELACNSWSDDVEVILAGFGQDESELLVDLNPDRVRAVSSVSEAAARLRRRVAAATTTLRHVSASDAFAGRIGDLAGDAWMPQVLLVADVDEHDRGALDQLTDDLAAAGRCAVAIASTGLTATDPRPADVRLDVAADGALHVTAGPLDVSVSAAGLPAKELEPLAEIMRQARARADEPVPPAAETESWAAGTDAAGGMLGLFGRDPARTPDPESHSQRETQDEETASPERPANAPLAPVVSIDPWSAERAADEKPGKVTADGASAITIPSLALTGSRRQVTAAIRQRRRQADPHLDRDLQAWNEQDPNLVRVGVLGPVTVAAPGEEPTERQRFLTEIIVFLAQRAARGATADKLSDALWPEGNVKDASRRVAITRARRWLGTTPTGDPWLPDMGADRTYRLEDGFLLDWHLFRRLRSRGEAHGPAGIRDLRAALELVRGIPLDGADRAYAVGTRNPYTWLPESEIYPGHVVSAIVDTAHELAEMYLEAGDTANARWTVERAWLADPYRGDDELWRDIMQAEHIDGHNAQLRQLLGELMQARDAEVPEDLAKSTYAWLRTALPDVLEPSTTSSS